jgi:hypothetical protein
MHNGGIASNELCDLRRAATQIHQTTSRAEADIAKRRD